MKRVIIIGGGVSGLAAGIYAQKNGFESVIYEKHTTLGGLCTNWQRNGYHIDGSISMLTGVKQGEELYDVWQELGAFQDEDIYYPEIFVTIKDSKKELNWYCDFIKLEQELLSVAPEDSEAIKVLIADLKSMQHIKINVKKSVESMSWFDWLKRIKGMAPAMQAAQKYTKMTVQELAKTFKSSLLQQAILSFVPEDFQAVAFMTTVANFNTRYSAKLLGGSQTLIANMTKQYEALGGSFYCQHSVKNILLTNNQATGIALRNGATVEADYIICACDPHITFNKLLPNTYMNDDYQEVLQKNNAYTTHSITQLFFGVNADLSHYPHYLIQEIDDIIRLNVEDKETKLLGFEHFSYDSTMATNGKTLLKTAIMTKTYDKWKALDKESYRQEKQQLADRFTHLLEQYYPEAKGKIEMIDVSTPKTIERYCGAYQGAYMGFTMGKDMKKQYLKSTIKGLNNVVLASQWLSLIGGLPTAATAGKFAIQTLCQKEKKKFNGVS